MGRNIHQAGPFTLPGTCASGVEFRRMQIGSEQGNVHEKILVSYLQGLGFRQSAHVFRG